MIDWSRERTGDQHPSRPSPTRDPDLQPGEPAAAHIVKTEPGESAAAKVLEARIYGIATRGSVRARVGPVARPEATAALRSLQERVRDVSDVQRGPQRITGHLSPVPDPAAGLRIREAVRALVIDPDHRVLLVRFEFPTATRWALPGGGLEPGERPRRCAST